MVTSHAASVPCWELLPFSGSSCLLHFPGSLQHDVFGRCWSRGNLACLSPSAKKRCQNWILEHLPKEFCPTGVPHELWAHEDVGIVIQEEAAMDTAVTVPVVAARVVDGQLTLDLLLPFLGVRGDPTKAKMLLAFQAAALHDGGHGHTIIQVRVCMLAQGLHTRLAQEALSS